MATRSPDKVKSDRKVPASPVQQKARRPAPPIAAQNFEAARRNIATKLQILRDFLSWSASGVQAAAAPSANLTLSDLPRSVRQFNGWDSAALREGLQPLFAKFFKNSNATLKKHEDLFELLVASMRAIDKNSSLSNAKEDSRAALLRKLTLANRLRLIAEKELIRARRELANERSKIEGLEGANDSIAKKAKDKFKTLETQNTNLRSENIRLTALLRQSGKLKSV